ncbi:hypothetical protein ACS0TY_007054 [Phlomoides rotata]
MGNGGTLTSPYSNGETAELTMIKETLRQHPPVPLLVRRIAVEDVKIKGYDVSAKTMVMINAWAIGRDPASWDEPEKFKPERFLNSLIDYKCLDFEFIPFGAGRRGCPGISFAVVTMEFVLANLVQKFNWKLPNGIEEKDLDMSESPGVTFHRSVPLLAVASQSYSLRPSISFTLVVDTISKKSCSE